MKHLAIIMVVLFLASCGSSDNEILSLNEDTGFIKATVTNSKSFNPNVSHGQIIKYVITVFAEDITRPIIKTFEGSAESGVIDDIPVGKDRIIKVEAINQNNAKIKEGESYNIEIRPSEITETEVDLVAVPVFANLGDGNIVPNTRFKAVIFNDGPDPVEIVDDFDNTELPMMDVSSMLTEIVPDVSTGLVTVSPKLLPAGKHRLTVTNLRNGKRTTITIVLADGSKMVPAPFYGASNGQINIGLGLVGQNGNL